MKRFCELSLLCCALVLIISLGTAFTQEAEHIRDKDKQMAVQEISAEQREQGSPFDRRMQYEKRLLGNPFAIITHKPNYILPLTYNTKPNNDPSTVFEGKADEVEMKFQLSFKIALWRKIFDNNGFFFFGYSQQSFWQAYNSLNSSPFRETNYEPELMLSFFTDYDVLGFRNRMITLSFVHQSNGQSGTLSRSWNRVYTNFIFERGNFYLSIKPWYRIPEDAGDDDNPDIHEYVGYGEIYALYVMGDTSAGIIVRNNLRSHNRWGIQLDLTFPLSNTLKGYVQYYGGYGESLIDYNHSNNRLGIGILLTNWM